MNPNTNGAATATQIAAAFDASKFPSHRAAERASAFLLVVGVSQPREQRDGTTFGDRRAERHRIAAIAS